MSASPLNTSEHLLKGALAVAVNGVPIFNVYNNRGENAYLIGELDDWGGHFGRGDDYHYHMVPTHLETTVGSENPLVIRTVIPFTVIPKRLWMMDLEDMITMVIIVIMINEAPTTFLL